MTRTNPCRPRASDAAGRYCTKWALPASFPGAVDRLVRYPVGSDSRLIATSGCADSTVSRHLPAPSPSVPSSPAPPDSSAAAVNVRDAPAGMVVVTSLPGRLAPVVDSCDGDLRRLFAGIDEPQTAHLTAVAARVEERDPMPATLARHRVVHCRQNPIGGPDVRQHFDVQLARQLQTPSALAWAKSARELSLLGAVLQVLGVEVDRLATVNGQRHRGRRTALRRRRRRCEPHLPRRSG